MRSIVTGATGFIGYAVTKELLKAGHEVLVVGRQNIILELDESEKLSFVFCDLANITSLVDKLSGEEYDMFYHFAWQGSAGDDRFDTALQLENAQWTIDALYTAKKLSCKKFVCAGSITEYEALAACYNDGNKPGLGYIYGSGKVVAHMMAMSVAANIGIDLIWGIITNAYGIGEDSPRLVNSTLKKCIRGENPQFTSGTQNYDFVYIDDVAIAFRLIGENGKAFHEYIIGSSNAKPLKEFLIEMKNAVAPNLDFVFGDIPFTGTNLPLSTFNCDKTELHTGFKAKVNFADGCKKTYLHLNNKIEKEE